MVDRSRTTDTILRQRGPVSAAVHIMRNVPALTAADLNTTVNHEPRILDVRLAEALGYEKPADIRPLIERHREALERLGAFIRIVRKNPGRGRPASEAWLTKKQALYLCTKSETERATEITIEVVEVYDAYVADHALPTVAGTTLPALDRKGLAVMRIGTRTVLVDTGRYEIVNEDAVVMTYDGKLKIERATCELSIDRLSNPNGRRFGWAPWRRHRKGAHRLGASASRDGIWIVGAIIDAVGGRRLGAV